ncbi:hypothetical protein G6F70_007532 [Rhizopus microsporus]|uniref:ATP-dependent DNA helicase CHL1 n=2 Tax=Rhizopus TaxID=4842 RepID=A0A367K3F4_RHIAZ|nr:hypothetical protein G6F71_008466 [Rhizopus microsporus]RCH96665.1 DEAD H (Asp-Glu-Ala-Asp His) box helicase 11 [Rhizopus azygosporus]KAG1196331.1 hypothetical protein G6F70_007532 [Rhizopus microsporus]KAG1206908.1 hypothetical protein G6F69_008473 [Rhizopus microsporus]KAG1230917.1 hypothetical protein G6F67_006126 [Rhizopus microsporus]
MSNIPDSFGFPFEPYSIQKDFMASLYRTLSQDKIGIFESPTGTGKSLSLICGSLKWLQDHEAKAAEPKQSTHSTDNEPDWVTAFQAQSAEGRKSSERERRKAELKDRIQRVRNIERDQAMFELESKDRKKKFKKQDALTDDDDEFLVEDYNSDDEEDTNDKTRSYLSKEVQELLNRFESKRKPKISYNDVEEEEDEDLFETKIYYASRTHSQLAQFVHEIHKTAYNQDLYEISLGSRKNLCINKDVNKLGSVHRINEACLDMQKKGSTKGPCSFLPSWDNKPKWDQFRDHAIARVRDIEELIKIGEKLTICPYYGSRKTVPSSQLVVLPYQHLLHANTRESLGISLKNSIVIIDEAHNLIETVTSLYTVTLSLVQIQLTWNQLSLYIQKYKERLLGKNVVYIKQILNILKMLIRHLQVEDKSKRKDRVMHVNEFLHQSSIDHLNMYKIKNYLEASNLARKLNGFIDKAKEKEEEKRRKQLADPNASTSPPPLPPALSSSIPTLTQVEALLLALTNPNKDGRIVISFGTTESPVASIKYMLLNPADAFKPLVDEAKSIILAGGTMEPVSDFSSLLFPNIPKERITHFSCGHIIPSTNLLTMTVEVGPTGKPLVYTFENRQDESLIDETGRTIANFCNVIPDGTVCFFPSFTYLDQMYKRWKENGILERIEKHKKVFREPKESNKVEATLRDYTLQIEVEDSKGALLLCVVNGKMSEGINFSDRLGRGVIMIGLPFANRNSVELIEKMKYAKEHTGHASDKLDGGMEYYENLCMRGVNQSIGRAIRHKGDYATIILLDKRYTTDRIRKKLPKWIGEHVENYDVFGKAMGRTSKFFREKNRSI